MFNNFKNLPNKSAFFKLEKEINYHKFHYLLSKLLYCVSLVFSLPYLCCILYLVNVLMFNAL